MASIFAQFKQAQIDGSGSALADTFIPEATGRNPDRLRSLYYFTNSANVASDVRYALLQDRSTGLKLPKQEGNAWVEIFVAFWKSSREIIKLEEDPKSGSWTNIFNAWKELSNQLLKGYSSGGLQAWTLPCLYAVGRYLRIFAMRADAEIAQNPAAFKDNYQDDVVSSRNPREKLEESSWILNRMYTTCLHDRAPIEESRKWGVYATVNLSFKTYFKLGSVASCKSLLHAMEASQSELPPLSAFPKSHVVTFKYYLGVINFLEENYVEAEEHLTYAWKLCHRDAKKNLELILTYLVPCHLVTSHTLPSKRLLEQFPRLERLFRPLAVCIRKGDLAGFDQAMVAGESEFVKRRIYLPLERARDIAVRNLFRKVFLAGGFVPSADGGPPIRRTRVPVNEFVAAVRLSMRTEEERRGEQGKSQKKEVHDEKERKTRKIERDEVECFLANLIYKNLLKGYISRERATVVLSKIGAFPGTGV
ncbi:hypothetical protein VTO42DRAFT_892 [Malbranchea cinnamomea]